MDTSSPPSSWYDPPEGHELCTCWDCHHNGEHLDAAIYWSLEGCELCEEWLDTIPDLKGD